MSISRTMREDDTSLLRRFADTGAQDAFATVVARNTNAVYSAALRRVGGDSHLAEDLVQQVFMRLALHAESLSRHPMLTAWLYATTRNTSANVVRTEVRRRTREQEACAMDEISRDRGAGAGWSDIAPYLDEVIDGLSEKDRSAVLLRFFDQLTFSEMARVLHSSEDAVRMRLDRALDKIRLSLERRGIASTSAALSGVLAQNVVLAAPSGLADTATHHAINAYPALPGSSGLGAFAATAAGAVLFLVTAVGGFYFHQLRRDAEAQLMNEQQRVRPIEPPAYRVDGAMVAGGIRSDAAVQSPAGPATRTRSGAQGVTNGLAPRFASGAETREGGRRAMVSAVYMPLYDKLGLSQEQIRRFEDIRVRGAVPALWMYSLDPVVAEAVAPIDTSASPASIDSELSTLLGPEAFAQYQLYNRRVPGRELATRLASAVYQYAPLSPDQADVLADIVAEGIYTTAGRAGDRTAADWALLMEKASSVLSPQQLDALAAVVRKKDALYQALAESSTHTSVPP